MSRTRDWLALALLAWAAGATACYRTQEQPDLSGQDVQLTVLHTSDIHSRLLPYRTQPGLIDRGLGLCAELQPIGGAARLKWLIDRERAKANRVMHLDSGDCFQGAPIFNQFKGEAEMRVMSALAPDGVVIGNHEFDLGAKNLAHQYRNWGFGTFPLLAANYIWSDPGDPSGHDLGRLSRPYEIINLQGLKVAIIGMGNTSSMTSIRHGGNSAGITPLEPVEALRTQVDIVQGQVDLIVVVSHMGLTARQELNLAEDTEVITGYERVVEEDAVLPCYYSDPQDCWQRIGTEPDGQVRVRVPGVRGIDAIFGGHLHIVLNPPKLLTDPAGRSVLLVHSGAFVKFFGRADIIVRVPKKGEVAPWGAEIVSHDYTILPVTNRVPKERLGEAATCPPCEGGKACFCWGPGGAKPIGAAAECTGAGEAPGQRTTEVEAGNDDAGVDAACRTLAGSTEQILDCERADACRLNGDSCSAACRSARSKCESVRAPVDGGMLELLDPFVIELYQQENLNFTFAYATERIERFGLSGEDSELGNLVADSMRFRNRVEAQFAMTNSLGIRTNMEEGLVSIEQMFNIFPFENSLTTMFLSGLEVQELFDYVTERSTERGCQTQAQISGVTFTMNCGQQLANLDAPQCVTSADCLTTEFHTKSSTVPSRCVAGQCFKSPAEDILIQGEPVVPTESYKVAVNDFIGRGGSGFEVLRRNTTKVDTGLSLRDALIDYMRTSPNEGGPGRVCGSPFMVDPIPAPVRPTVVYDKALEPNRSCDPAPGLDRPADLPGSCGPVGGAYVSCEDGDKLVKVYCIPYDFRTPEAIAQVMPPLDQILHPAGSESSACALGTPRECNGQKHCFEVTRDNGTVEANFFCMVPFCIDPPPTGRIIRRIAE